MKRLIGAKCHLVWAKGESTMKRISDLNGEMIHHQLIWRSLKYNLILIMLSHVNIKTTVKQLLKCKACRVTIILFYWQSSTIFCGDRQSAVWLLTTAALLGGTQHLRHRPLRLDATTVEYTESNAGWEQIKTRQELNSVIWPIKTESDAAADAGSVSGWEQDEYVDTWGDHSFLISRWLLRVCNRRTTYC